MSICDDFESNSVAIRADHRLALSIAPTQRGGAFSEDSPHLTPEEQEERRRRTAGRHAADEAAAERTRAREAGLREASEGYPVALAVLVLHEAQASSGSAWCGSCGDSYEAAEWPCPTVLAVAREVGFDGFG